MYFTESLKPVVVGSNPTVGFKKNSPAVFTAGQNIEKTATTVATVKAAFLFILGFKLGVDYVVTAFSFHLTLGWMFLRRTAT